MGEENEMNDEVKESLKVIEVLKRVKDENEAMHYTLSRAASDLRAIANRLEKREVEQKNEA